MLPSQLSLSCSTIRLHDAARPPRRTPWLSAISARLPVPLLLGLRVAARRPRRVVLSTASIFIVVTGIVAVLAARAQFGQDAQLVGGTDPSTDRFNQVMLVITASLVALAAVNAIVVTWATALDARHSSALARALGATPQQVSTGLSAAQVLPALLGVVLGIPGGLAPRARCRARQRAQRAARASAHGLKNGASAVRAAVAAFEATELGYGR